MASSVFKSPFVPPNLPHLYQKNRNKNFVRIFWFDIFFCRPGQTFLQNFCWFFGLFGDSKGKFWNQMSFTIIPAYLINFPSIFDPSFYLECGFGCHLWMAPCVTLITCHIYLTHMTFCSFLSPFIFCNTNTGPMVPY